VRTRRSRDSPLLPVGIQEGSVPLDRRRATRGAVGSNGPRENLGYGQPGLLGQPRYKRTSKKEGLVLDLGKRVRPFITPDDLERVETLIRERAGLGPAGPTVSAPFI